MKNQKEVTVEATRQKEIISSPYAAISHLIKESHPGATPKYKTPHNLELNTASDTLESYLSGIIKRFEGFHSILLLISDNTDDRALQDAIDTLDILIDSALDEMISFTNACQNNIGEIQVTTAYSVPNSQILKLNNRLCIDAALANPVNDQQTRSYGIDPKIYEMLKDLSPEKIKQIKTMIEIFLMGSLMGQHD